MPEASAEVALPGSTRLAIELGTEILVESPRVSGRLRSQLVGMASGQYLIVKAPVTPELGALHKVYPDGDELVLRYLYNGTVFGFRSLVIGAVTHPARLLFLDYPSSVDEHNIRNSPRLECFIPCRVDLGGEAQAEGTIIDISQTGCQVLLRSDHLEAEIAQDAAVELHFFMPGKDTEHVLKGDIRRLSRDPRRVRLGVAFSTPAENVYRSVYDYLSPTL